MMQRPPAWFLAATLLAALLGGLGCAGSANPVPEAQDGTAATPVGSTETVQGTETLEYEGDLEVLAAGPELTRWEERGLMIFRHYCAHCHGASGAGDGQNSYGLETPPRDLLAIEMDAKTDEHLQRVISEGGAAHGFSRLMPPWGHTLQPNRIADLIRAIRILPDLEGLEEETDIPSLDDDGLGDDDMDDFSL
jgi:mono/diheme cytochrome c family protein